ncbi:MAG: putative ABC transporter permease [Clostridiales bacterium]|nr:putative ABC transporter permease [Clostridiales bacterium]
MTELYKYVWLFYIYAFLGWVLEVAFSAIKKGELINRGFLNGAWCPIYGAGAVLICFFLDPVENIYLLFLTSVFITSLLELLTGFVLEKVYKTKWWNYSDRKLNFKGYICLEISIVWGVLGVVLKKVVNPMILILVGLVPFALGVFILCVLTGLFVCDLIITLLALNNMLSRAEKLDKLAKEMRAVSDDLSEVVFEKASELEKVRKEQSEKVKETEKKVKERNEKRLAELKEKYNRLVEERIYTHTRLLKAFPELKSIEHQNQFEELKKRLTIKMKKG